MLSLALAHQRRQHHHPGALGQCQHLIDHLTDRLRLKPSMVSRAMGIADTSEQQSQIIVYLGDGADSRAWVV